MTEKITVYIGDGSYLDGGPFDGERIVGHDGEVLYFDKYKPADAVPRHELFDLVGEINSGQPGRIKGVAKSESFMSVRIECHDGVLFETDGRVASGMELDASGDLRRQFSRSFRNHGGEISENY